MRQYRGRELQDPSKAPTPKYGPHAVAGSARAGLPNVLISSCLSRQPTAHFYHFDEHQRQPDVLNFRDFLNQPNAQQERRAGESSLLALSGGLGRSGAFICCSSFNYLAFINFRGQCQPRSRTGIQHSPKSKSDKAPTDLEIRSKGVYLRYRTRSA